MESLEAFRLLAEAHSVTQKLVLFHTDIFLH